MKFRGAVILTAAIFVLIAAVPAAVAGFRVLESQPAFCYACHEEHPAHAGWLASGAARHHPNCIMCHSAPGISGIVAAQVKGATHLVKHFTGDFQNPIARADVPNANCTQCHRDDQIARKHRRIRDFVARQCAECHNHKPGARFGEREGD